MNQTLDQLKATLDDLTATQRMELAEYLLTLIEPQDNEVRAEWLSVAEKRMNDVRSGKVVGIPAEQVLDNLSGTAT